MRRRILATLLFVTALCAISETAFAQFAMQSQRTIRIGFGGGVSVPIDDAESAFESGINGQAYILLNLMGLPLRFNIGYQKLNLKEILQQPGTEGSTQILSGVGGLKLDLWSGPLRPYISAGVGAFNVKNEVDGTDGESEFKFGIDGGAGIAFNLGRLEGFLEGRIQNIYTDQGVIDFKSVRIIPVTFGILF